VIDLTILEGKAVEIDTAAAFERMRAAADAEGVTLRVVSGFRSMQKQRELYEGYRNGGALAAVPGFSNHQSGHALDLNTFARGVYAWLVRNAASYGFKRTVPSEAWHWEAW
jgi:LAS superfamily LD-carboxypeptidase LdcB